MGLHEWQRELSAMVTSGLGTTPQLVEAGLTADERRWLLATTRDSGLRVTRHAQRSWRRMRLLNALPMTMRVLPIEDREVLVESYLDTIACVSFFYTHEGRGFARFLATASTDPHALALASFEVAVADALEYPLFEAAQPASRSIHADSRLRMHPAATLVSFAAAPERVIAATLAGVELPPPEQEPYVLLVTPGLPSLARTVDRVELARLEACTNNITVGEFVARQPELAPWIEQLLSEQTLV